MVISKELTGALEEGSVELNELLMFMTKKGASDLHLKPMRPPLLRIQGRLIPIKAKPLKPKRSRRCSARS